jgi:glycosyltransferase involved in cell wall biosynthesis
MKIALNGQWYSNKKNNGISRYIENLYGRIFQIDKENFYYLFLNEPSCFLQRIASDKVQFRHSFGPETNKYIRTLWENVTLPIEVSRIKPDIFHSLNYSLPFFLKPDVKKLAIVYDLIWVKFPEFFSRDTVLAAKRKFQHMCNVADKIISISNSTKNDILEHFKCEANKIEVVYPGVDLLLFKKIVDNDILNTVRAKYNLPSKFILWIGEPRKNKNLRLLFEAFVDAKLSNNLAHSLVVCSNKVNEWQDAKDIFKRFKEFFVIIDNVSNEDLPVFYNLADIFLFPSLYEGFGLPPLEAMACGTPVVVSNSTSLPEIVGEAALKVDPNKPYEIGEAIARVLCDEQLRIKLIKAGRQRVENYRWENSVKLLLRVFEDLQRQ